MAAHLVPGEIASRFDVSEGTVINLIETDLRTPQPTVEFRLTYECRRDWGLLLRGPIEVAVAHVEEIRRTKIDWSRGAATGAILELEVLAVERLVRSKKRFHLRPLELNPAPRGAGFGGKNGVVLKALVTMMTSAPKLQADSALQMLLDGGAEIDGDPHEVRAWLAREAEARVRGRG